MRGLTRLTAAVFLAVAVIGAGAAYAVTAPAPLPLSRTIGDPSVVATGSGYVLTATGTAVPRATSTDGVHWSWTTPALTTLPSWVNKAGGDIWATDIAKVNGYYLLFYSAPVAGLKASSRCIGVAHANAATASFIPYGSQPLVCPSTATAPSGGTKPVAPDQMIDPGQTSTATNVIGAIDAEFFRDPQTGRNWLFYKQDGLPSAIRLLPLRGDGVRAGGASIPIITSSGVIENPSVVQVGTTYFLFASTRSWSHCTYQTVWFSTRTITAWPDPGHDWLTQTSTGLCGPGGLDVIRSGSTISVYLAAWTCSWKPTPCPSTFAATNPGFHGVRSLYGARIVFQNGKPVLTHWFPY